MYVCMYARVYVCVVQILVYYTYREYSVIKLPVNIDGIFKIFSRIKGDKIFQLVFLTATFDVIFVVSSIACGQSCHN